MGYSGKKVKKAFTKKNDLQINWIGRVSRLIGSKIKNFILRPRGGFLLEIPNFAALQKSGWQGYSQEFKVAARLIWVIS